MFYKFVVPLALLLSLLGESCHLVHNLGILGELLGEQEGEWVFLVFLVELLGELRFGVGSLGLGEQGAGVCCSSLVPSLPPGACVS